MSRVRIDAQLILVGDSHDAALATAVLQALEQDPVLAPELWGAEEGLRDPYDRADFLAALAAYSDLAPRLYRVAKPCSFTAKWFGSVAVATLVLEGRYYHDADEAALFFRAMSRLAALLPTEWGHVTQEFEKAVPGSALQSPSNYTHIRYYERNGPSCLFPRTFVGTRLLGLMPSAIAESLGRKHNAIRLTNGTLQLDLVANSRLRAQGGDEAACRFSRADAIVARGSLSGRARGALAQPDSG
jgi:hypothetical protein